MFQSDRLDVLIRAGTRLVFSLLIACVPTTGAIAATFTVNSEGDVLDANPGDGICRTAPTNTVCTLRAAIQEASALAGADTIVLQANATYQLTRPGLDDTGQNGDLDILGNLTISGAGPASTVIDGNGAVTLDRVIQIAPEGIANVSGVSIVNGRAAAPGGGIYNQGRLALTNSVVANNTTSVDWGGGIANDFNLLIVDSTLRDNTAPGLPGGGLMVFTGTVTLIGCTVSGNRAGFGGGVYALDTTVNLVNTTVSGNFATGSGGGVLASGGTVGLFNVTVFSNEANSDGSGVGIGGGVYGPPGGTVALSNSIVSANIFRDGFFITSDDCAGNLTSNGKNLLTNVAPSRCSIAGAFASGPSGLGPLQSNGGPTLTHALLGGLALDSGPALGCTDQLGATLTTDQRGEPRPVGAACDLGAFERGDAIFRDGFDS